MRRRHHKPKVFWLQDRPRRGRALLLSNGTGAGGGVITTTFVPAFVETNQVAWDPADTRSEASVFGASFAIQQNPQAQMAQDKGWRVMRAVGNFRVALKQTNNETVSSSVYQAAPNVHVMAGLCVRTRDDNGVYLDDDRWQLGDSSVAPSDADKGISMRGNAAPWLWRRSWILRNSMATGSSNQPVASGQAVYAGLETGVGQMAMQGTYSSIYDGFKYPMGYMCSDHYPSIYTGSYVDMKRHVTLKANQELWFACSAIDIEYNVNSYIGLYVQPDFRYLIARGGKPFRYTR